MATTWYFKSSSWNSVAGPDSSYYVADALDINYYFLSYNYNYKMEDTAGTSEVSDSKAIPTSTNPTYYKALHFVSPPLAAQTLSGSGTGYRVAVGITESSGNMNLYHRIFVYVWRSGTGNVKTISPGVGGIGTSCATEHGTSKKECVITFNGTSGDFSILDNDRIVVECILDVRNSKETSYTAYLYWAGTDTTFTDDATTTSAGSYFYCPQTLNLMFPYAKTVPGGVSFGGTYSYVHTPVAGGPKTYTATGAESFVGILSRLINNLTRVYPGSLSFSGGIIRKEVTKVLSGVSSFAGTVLKAISKTYPGTLSFAGAVAKAIRKTYGGSISFSGGILNKSITKVFTGVLSLSGIINKALLKSYSSSLTFSGTVAKNIPRAYSGFLSSTGTVLKGIAKTYSGSLSYAGTVAKAIRKTYDGTLSFSGGIINKAISKTFLGTITFSGGIINKQITKVFAGVLSFSGGIKNKYITKTFSGALSSAGVISRVLGKIKSGIVYISGDLINILLEKSASLSATKALSFSGGIVNKLITKTFAGVISIAGEYAYVFTQAGGNAYTYTADGVLTIAGAISRLINNLTRIYAGAVSTSGVATRLINNLTRAYYGVVSTAGTLTRLIDNLTRTYSGTSTFVGSISRQINLLTRTVSSAVSMVGEYSYDLIGQVSRTIYGEIGFTGVVTNDHEEIISITMPTPTLRRRTLQFIPEAFYFKVNPGDGGRFKGEIMVQDGIVPVPVPIVEDPEKMNQKEFEDWRNRTSRRR